MYARHTPIHPSGSGGESSSSQSVVHISGANPTSTRMPTERHALEARHGTGRAGRLADVAALSIVPLADRDLSFVREML